MKKKLLSLLMVMAMVLTLVPMTAMAYGSTSVGSSNASSSHTATIHFYVQEGNIYQSSMVSISQATHVTDVSVTAYSWNSSVSASEFMKCLPSAYASYDDGNYAYVSSSQSGFGASEDIGSSTKNFYVIFSGSVPGSGGDSTTTDPDADEVTLTFYNLYWNADGSYRIGESTTITTECDNTNSSHSDDMHFVEYGITREAQNQLADVLDDGYTYLDLFSFSASGNTYPVPAYAFSTGNYDIYTSNYNVVYLHAEQDAEPEPTTYEITFAPGTDADVENLPNAQTDLTSGSLVYLTTTPTRDDGYTFAGWKDDAGNTYDAVETISITEDLHLTAQWDAPVLAEFTVTYAAGKTVDGDILDGTDYTETVTDGDEITLPGATRTNLKGWDYQFMGWDSDGDTTADHQSGDLYPVTDDVTFTAIWQLYSISGDRAWDVTDAMIIMESYKGVATLTEEQLAIGDYNDDGKTCDVVDAMVIMEEYKAATPA